MVYISLQIINTRVHFLSAPGIFAHRVYNWNEEILTYTTKYQSCGNIILRSLMNQLYIMYLLVDCKSVSF